MLKYKRTIILIVLVMVPILVLMGLFTNLTSATASNTLTGPNVIDHIGSLNVDNHNQKTNGSGENAFILVEQSEKIEPLVLDELAEHGQTDYFIWMAEKADLSPAYQLRTKEEKGQFVYETLVETAERTQADLRAYLDEQGADYRPFYIANKILVRGGDQSLLMALAARSNVARITANHIIQLEDPIITPNYLNLPTSVQAVEPNIAFVNADDVWMMGYTGQGIVLAGNDTGIDWDHPALINQYRGCLNPPSCSLVNHNYNWWDATGTFPNAPGDDDGHGTHTTGTMVGDDGGANQIGMAPDARTIHCKNIAENSGSEATFTECFEWDLAPWDLNGQNPRPDLAPDAINNSWGGVRGILPLKMRSLHCMPLVFWLRLPLVIEGQPARLYMHLVNMIRC